MIAEATVLAETAGRVHRGFKREVDDLWPRLEKALKNNTLPLWFAGHSLGGAMATICASRCQLFGRTAGIEEQRGVIERHVRDQQPAEDIDPWQATRSDHVVDAPLSLD